MHTVLRTKNECEFLSKVVVLVVVLSFGLFNELSRINTINSNSHFLSLQHTYTQVSIVLRALPMFPKKVS